MERAHRNLPLFDRTRGDDHTPSLLLRIHRFLFVRHPHITFLASVSVYASIILAFGKSLAISSNYFILLPVLACALSYGFIGGVIGGALGLPANLALFAILGHPEFSPASKLVAEFSGVFVGGALGYLSEYYRQLELEIQRQIETEKSLRAALDDKGLLLRELHHRVKNNLNIIKSLIQLQRNRTKDPAFLEASDKLLGRVFAIARAHDALYGTDEFEDVAPEEYLKDILDAFCVDDSGAACIETEIQSEGRHLTGDTAVPLGLILNEVVSNAFKHAFPGGMTHAYVSVQFVRQGENWILEVRDNGIGFDPSLVPSSGLGLKIIRGLTGQLEGKASWTTDGGTLFRLEFPLAPERGEIDNPSEQSPHRGLPHQRSPIEG